MNKKQLWLIIGGFILIQVFYFGFDTVQLDKEGQVDSSGEIMADHAWDDHLDDALAILSEEDRDTVSVWMQLAQENDILSLKQLASFWVSKSEWELGGHYLEEIAAIAPTAENSITAARTYATGAQQSEDAAHQTILRQKAISLYDQAIDQDADGFSTELEKTLFQIKAPDGESPMQGILSLVELSKKYPDRPEVFIHLGRFSIQTGQWDKAQERLEIAYKLDPENKETICLLSSVYKQIGDVDKSAEFSSRCDNK